MQRNCSLWLLQRPQGCLCPFLLQCCCSVQRALMWAAPSKLKKAAAAFPAGLPVWHIVGGSPPFVAVENQITRGDRSTSFCSEMVNTHRKKLLRPVRSCSMERAPRHYSTVMIIVKRIWLPQRVSIIVSFGSKLNNWLLSNFHPPIPEIAFHFSLFYSTMLRGKGNFMSNSCLSSRPRNSCKYYLSNVPDIPSHRLCHCSWQQTLWGV